MIYDGECRFCCFWVERWKLWVGEWVDFVTSQSLSGKYPEIPEQDFDRAVQLLLPDGRVLSGAEAVAESLAARWGWLRTVFHGLPGLAGLAEWGYRLVANNRGAFSRVWRLLWGSHLEVAEYRLSAWLFLRGIGLVYLIAFWSLWTQIIPLSGESGIMPIVERMEGMRMSAGDMSGLEKMWRVPTVFWLGSWDGFIHGVCALGCLLACAVMVGLFTMPCLAGLWILYLSLLTVCVPWLNFQWDTLLLEAGLLALFVARFGLFEDPRRLKAPRIIPLLLVRWLLFRLMFASGMVKLLSGDAMWADWTALAVHYETQPLPVPWAWQMHNLPMWFHQLSCGIMYGIELVVPFFFFLPRRLRLCACAATVALMVVIICTGNYTFFNLLVIVLCVSLVDDRVLKRVLPERLRVRVGGKAGEMGGRIGALLCWGRVGATAVFLAVTVWFSAIHMLPKVKMQVPSSMYRWAGKIGQFHLINGYGLFSVMTKDRPEIVLEGSADGVTWIAYEFRYKPGDLKRGLPVVAPHQPRLDWQMWFAALGNVQRNYWVPMLAIRLLEGNEGVVGLLEGNPFPDVPPRYVRAQLYLYSFTTPEEREATGAWWTREFVRGYLQPISLDVLGRE